MQHSFDHIIEGCRQGIAKCQVQLYHQFYGDMMKVCTLYTKNMDDAGVVYNNAMFKVFSNIKQYKGDGNFGGWVRRIVVNSCIDHCRSMARFTDKELKDEHELYATALPDVYSNIEAKEIVALIKELPLNTSLVFGMYVLEGYKHEEIATQLGISIGTSKWHLSEARRLLKNKIQSLSNKEIYLHAI